MRVEALLYIAIGNPATCNSVKFCYYGRESIVAELVVTVKQKRQDVEDTVVLRDQYAGNMDSSVEEEFSKAPSCQNMAK